MKVLAVDTSTLICSVCLWEDGKVVSEYVSETDRTHSERLLPAVELLLRQASWNVKDLNVLGVVNGPGSFTGLRISLSAIKGLSFVHSIPVIAVNALEAAASQVPDDGLICPAMDARRKEIFTCLFDRSSGLLKQHVEPCSIRPENWFENLPKEPVVFCGPGARLYWHLFERNPDSRLAFSKFVLARTVAEIAGKRFAKGEFMDGSDLKAAYLRPSDAEAKSTTEAQKHRERIE